MTSLPTNQRHTSNSSSTASSDGLFKDLNYHPSASMIDDTQKRAGSSASSGDYSSITSSLSVETRYLRENYRWNMMCRQQFCRNKARQQYQHSLMNLPINNADFYSKMPPYEGGQYLSSYDYVASKVVSNNKQEPSTNEDHDPQVSTTDGLSVLEPTVSCSTEPTAHEKSHTVPSSLYPVLRCSGDDSPSSKDGETNTTVGETSNPNTMQLENNDSSAAKQAKTVAEEELKSNRGNRTSSLSSSSCASDGGFDDDSALSFDKNEAPPEAVPSVPNALTPRSGLKLPSDDMPEEHELDLTLHHKNCSTKEEKQQNQSDTTTYIKRSEINIHKDILCARGGEGNNNPANISYLLEIRKAHPAYKLLNERTQKKEKKQMSLDVINRIKSNGGRFLRKKKDKDGGDLWYEIKDTPLLRKVSQALRDDTPKEKKEKESGKKHVDTNNKAAEESNSPKTKKRKHS